MKRTKLSFAPGMRIIVRGEEWMIKKIESNSFGGQTIHAIGLSALVKDKPMRFLVDLEKEIEIVDPTNTRLVADDSPFFNSSRLFLESQWRQKVPTHTNLHIGNQAAMNLVPFQLEPAQLALRQTRQRILIADSVGLGKTLEAGILMSELIARGKGKRILVVTVKSMMTQFQKEMWNRFTVPLVRLDSRRIQRIRAEIPTNHNPFYYYDRTIVSMDTLKRDVEYRTHLENAWWDIIVIDEAHNVATRGNRQAQRARLAELLAKRSDTLIMLSATPHDGRSESFASLMNMLDSTAIANPEKYTKEEIKGLCIRRFKKDVQDQVRGAFQERKITIEKSKASANEESAFQVFTEIQLAMDEKGRGGSQLFKTTLEKSMFSSPAACIKSINERIRRTEKNADSADLKDIQALTRLRDALEEIKPQDFSRYTQLVKLLECPEYGWDKHDREDRIVIFTERIETMKYVAEQLEENLKLQKNAIQTLHGGMTDSEQQRIVEEFGRTESPLRILVASDVASEGINLHYLSHRLIHFDIPWSLMVFQQRNGRIDRYGQTKNPDIRYMMTESANEKIKGDLRILEILIEKEEQAHKNIGDPAILMGVFDQMEEELVTAQAIEKGINPEDFASSLEKEDEELDLLELLMMDAGDEGKDVQVQPADTLFTDLDYLKKALDYFKQTENYRVEEIRSGQGLEIELNPSLKRKLEAYLPEEAFPQDNVLRLSADKEYCMEEVRRSLQLDLVESAWPQTQFLWALHPIYEWVNDQAALLYGRQEAPLLGLGGGLGKGEYLYIMAGIIPNRKSTPVVDEWFALHFKDGQFIGSLTMKEVKTLTKIDENNIPNLNALEKEQIQEAESLLPSVVKQAYILMNKHYKEYKANVDPLINEELDKLAELQNRHRLHWEESLASQHKKREQALRRVDKIFEDFVCWVRDTLEIQDAPYIRVLGTITGVEK